MAVWRTVEQKTHARHMALCSIETAYEWLRSQAPSNDAEARAGLWADPVYLLSDYVLYRRNDPLLDLALARWSRVPAVVKRVHHRGGGVVRMAAWSNMTEKFLTATGVWADTTALAALVAHGTLSELRAFAGNPMLNDQVLEDMFKRKGAFAGISDQRWQNLLLGVATNTRLSTPWKGTSGDISEFHYDQVFKYAWSIAETAPTTQRWAAVVLKVLTDCRMPYGLQDKAHDMIARWHVDPPHTPKIGNMGSYWTGPGFSLRSRLADLLEADGDLLRSNDLALRMSYFRRFDPKKYSDWPQLIRAEFAADTPDACLEAALDNQAIWKIEAGRMQLLTLSRECPDPKSWGDMMETHMYAVNRMKKKFPDIFAEHDYEYHEPPPPSLESKIDALTTQVSALSAVKTTKVGLSIVPWWAWLAAGAVGNRILLWLH